VDWKSADFSFGFELVMSKEGIYRLALAGEQRGPLKMVQERSRTLGLFQRMGGL
jgi:hypothetical protein